MPAIPLGLAKLAVAVTTTVTLASAGYGALRPPQQSTPEARRQVLIEQREDWRRLTEQEQRRQLRRGVNADNVRKGGSSLREAPSRPRLLEQLRKLPKPRLPRLHR